MEFIFLLHSELKPAGTSVSNNNINEVYKNYSEARQNALKIVARRNNNLLNKIGFDVNSDYIKGMLFSEVAPDTWMNLHETITIIVQPITEFRKSRSVKKAENPSPVKILPGKKMLVN